MMNKKEIEGNYKGRHKCCYRKLQIRCRQIAFFFFFFFCQRQQEIEIPGNNDLCEGFCNTINSFSRRSKSIEIQSIIKKIQKENTLNTLRKNILKTCLGIFFERFKDALRDFSMSCVLITIGE